MADLLYIGIMAAFFGLAAAFVAGCERIIGAGASYEKTEEQTDGQPPDPKADPTPEPQELVA